MLRSFTRADLYGLQRHVASPDIISLLRHHGFRNSSYQKSRKFQKSQDKEEGKKPTSPYIQGQMHEKQREYFYYVDSHGRLYLNDVRLKNFLTSFKDKRFLTDAFSKLNLNEGRHKDEFPFLFKCRRTEINYVCCEAVPIVFTHIDGIEKDEGGLQIVLNYNHADPSVAMVPFEPNKLFMSDSGRMYHPGPMRTGGIGLISTELSIILSQMLEFENGHDNAPTHIWWQNEKLLLDVDWYKDAYISRFIM